MAVVLDEDQIPEFDETRAAAVDLAAVAGRVAIRTRLRTTVDVDFGARAARAGFAHFPEIVLFAEPQDLVGRDVGLRPPPVVGLVVRGVHRGPQRGFGQLPHVGQQLPGPGDCLLFVVIAERPVPQHLEEGVVIGVAADFFEVVVLARHAQAFLRIDDARVARPFAPEKDVLERHHAGVGEQQRRVAARNQRGARHHVVATRGEEFQKAVADFVAGHGQHFQRNGEASCGPVGRISEA